MDLSLKKVNEEVFIASEEIVSFDSKQIDFIKKCAFQNSRGRARICAHKKPTDDLHEMLIGIRADSYIRPHRHHEKVESFHLIEGIADIVILQDDGKIAKVIELSASHNFYYRLESPKYHTLLINSPLLIIHEITNGPFDASKSDFASFSPPEGDDKVSEYINQLRHRVEEYKINTLL